MSSGFFQTAISGLNAAQLGLATTSNNISNASTPGYSRERIVQTTAPTIYTGSGFIGQGTSVSTIQRIYSQYLNNQLLTAQTGAASSSAYLSQIQQLDNMLSGSTTGLSVSIASAFSAIQTLTANPSSTSARQSVLSSAQALASTFQNVNQQIAAVRTGVNSQITSTIGTINSLATQIGNINQQIIVAQAAGGGTQPANALLDQRDQLISQLNQQVQVQTVSQSNGSISLFIGNGQPLVLGTQVSSLVASPDANDPTQIDVAMANPSGGSPVVLADSMITGGSLGGLLSFRDQSLNSIQNGIGQIAVAMSSSFNSVNALGTTLSGTAGGAFFSVSGPTVFANANNTSSPPATISGQIIDSNYQVSYDTTNGYTITRLSDGSTLGSPYATLPQTVDGVQISLGSGTPAQGDVFLVDPDLAPGSRVLAQSSNTGTAVLDSTGSNVQALNGSDYSLSYSATNQWTLTRLSDNTSWTGTGADPTSALANLQTQIQTGVNLTLGANAPTVGDSFLIEPTRNAAANFSVALQNTNSIAAAMPITTAATSANSGNATISAASVVTAQTLPVPTMTLTYNSTTQQFTVTGANPAVANPISYNPTNGSANLNFNGITFTITGTPKNGDTFTIGPNTSGVSDNRTLQLLGNLQTTNLLNGSPNSTSAGATSTFASAYAQIVSQVGNTTNAVTVQQTAQNNQVTQMQSAVSSMSGVNLDEEAANLIQYQQAYQAAAKIIDVAGKLFDQIIALNP